MHAKACIHWLKYTTTKSFFEHPFTRREVLTSVSQLFFDPMKVKIVSGDPLMHNYKIIFVFLFIMDLFCSMIVKNVLIQSINS